VSSVPEEHRRAAPTSVRCAVLTVSDTRTLATDTGGQLLVDLLECSGHRVLDRQIVRDDLSAIREWVTRWRDRSDIEAIFITGGTGLSRRDQTIEAIRPMFEKELPGFGELFRLLSFQKIGPAAILSRATAGLVGRIMVFALPGSPGAIQLAMEKLVLPELGHVIRESQR